MDITQVDALSIKQKYTNYGTPNNFIVDGKIISGYIFTKTEFLKLFSNPGKDLFYIFLGMTKTAEGFDFITPIIGRIKHDGKIDGETLIYCNTPSYAYPSMDKITAGQQMANVIPFLSITDRKKMTAPIDPSDAKKTNAPITQVDAKRMIDSHLIDGKPLNLVLPTGSRVAGYTLGKADIDYLLAGDEPDRLFIMPALLDIDENGEDVVPDHLTLIFTWLNNDGSIFTVKMTDYCLPCPSGCYNF